MTQVRVDFFKPTGKWYINESIEWTSKNENIMRAFAESLYAHLKDKTGGIRMSNMLAICLFPESPYAHPIMMNVDDIFNYLQVDESNRMNVEFEETPPMGFDPY